ncbi:MAG: hypothetical protein J3K34DRAFT_521903 [Monoraphidium minutum]|nr:MAG: hypothetical protein J3K34DRAFT_521903 [Monoraphidium minutum]
MGVLRVLRRTAAGARARAVHAVISGWRAATRCAPPVVRRALGDRDAAACRRSVAVGALAAAATACGAAPVRAAAAAAAQRLWIVNAAVNVWALCWTVRFWRQADAVVLCRALPARGGNPARTIKVARLALARALADATELRREVEEQQQLLSAQRAFILAQGDGGRPAPRGGGWPRRQPAGGAGAPSGGGGAPAGGAQRAAGGAQRAAGGAQRAAGGAQRAAGAAAGRAAPEPLEDGEGLTGGGGQCGGGGGPGRPGAAAVALGECEVCWARPRDTALGCGHLACARCSVLMAACPFCRCPVAQRLRVWA